jgi:hypothetical protein
MTKKRWRDAFSAEEKQQRVRPEATDEYLNNPHTGWATFQRFAGDPLQEDASWHDDLGPVKFPRQRPARIPTAGDLPTSVSYCRWPWAVLEPEKGRIRFDILDAALSAARRVGQTLQVRFEPYTKKVDYSVTPPTSRRHPEGASVDVPPWYWDTGATWLDKAVYAANEPDSNDALYLKHWSDFVRGFARRYDGHPDLESVDVSYAGFWGESGGNASAESSAKLVDAYLRAFRKTTLLSMISTHGCRHAAKVSDRPMGWRGDGFLDPKYRAKGHCPDGLVWNHMWDVYPVDIFDYGIAEAWKTAPVTIEPHATLVHLLPPSARKRWPHVTAGQLKHGEWQVEPLLEMLLKYHPTIFMHKSVPIPPEWREAVEAFAKRLGYRFYLHQMILPLSARPGERVQTTVTIDNRGVAPIYRPYQFALRFSQGRTHHVVPFNQDIRAWMPDYNSFRETFTIPRGLSKGEAAVSCGIVHDDKPVVRLAIKAVDKDGWHPLTKIDVV